eukprot:PhF_6_TR732/c0_g1_i1/m.1176
MDLINYSAQLRILRSGFNPNTNHSHHILFERSVEIEIHEFSKPPVMSHIWITITTNCKDIRVIVSSENNMFLQYRFVINSDNFHGWALEQRLSMSFQDAPSKLIKLFSGCVDDPTRFLIILKPPNDSEALGSLQVVTREQDIFHTLALFQLEKPSLREIKDDINFRYHEAKKRLRVMFGTFQNDVFPMISK